MQAALQLARHRQAWQISERSADDHMKALISLSIYCLLALSGHAAPEENWVILPKAPFTSIKGFWMPEGKLALNLIGQSKDYVASYLKPDSTDFLPRSAAGILKNWSSYVCQVVGYSDEKGGMCVILNFSPLPSDKIPAIHDWRKQYIDVCDGGFYYWRVIYDMKSQRFVSFIPHDEA